MTLVSPDIVDDPDARAVDEAIDVEEANHSSAVVTWSEVLERMECELDSARTHEEPVPWSLPITPGPIPAELQERVAKLLETQLHTIRHLEHVRQTTEKHLAAIEAIPRVQAGPSSAYFDLIG